MELSRKDIGSFHLEVSLLDFMIMQEVTKILLNFNNQIKFYDYRLQELPNIGYEFHILKLISETILCGTSKALNKLSFGAI